MKKTVLFLFAAAITTLAGCGYHLGGLKPAPMNKIETVSISVFANDSLEIQASGLVTNSLSTALQRDGTYKLKAKRDADARIEGRVVSITYDQLRSSNQDTYQSSEIGLNLTVAYKVIEARTNRVLIESTVRTQASLFNLGNQQTAKTNALSYAARMAGDRISDNITNG